MAVEVPWAPLEWTLVASTRSTTRAIKSLALLRNFRAYAFTAKLPQLRQQVTYVAGQIQAATLILGLRHTRATQTVQQKVTPAIAPRECVLLNQPTQNET